LTLRSAVKGVVDYSKADLHSPSWWRHWRFLVQAMSEAESGELLNKAFEYQLALVSNSRTSADDFSKTQRKAKEIFEDIQGALRPWTGRSKEDRQLSETEEFKKIWEQLAGFNPDDKEALAKWSEEIEKHTQAASQAQIAAEQEKKERQSSFYDKIEAVRLKRFKQRQGRG